VAVFCKRILRQSVVLQFLAVGNALKPDGIHRVADEAQVVGVDPDVEEAVKPFREFRIEAEALNEILPAVHTLP
jgi:hypothetical protein